MLTNNVDPQKGGEANYASSRKDLAHCGLFISFISNKKQKQRSCSINYFFKDRNNIFMYNVYDTKRLKRIMQQKSFKGKKCVFR